MAKYQRLEEDYTPPQAETEVVEDGSFVRKRKRLEGMATQEQAQSSTNEYDVQQTAWTYTGIIGILVTLGSILSTLLNPETAPVMLVPLLYMSGAIFLLRRR